MALEMPFNLFHICMNLSPISLSVIFKKLLHSHDFDEGYCSPSVFQPCYHLNFISFLNKDLMETSPELSIRR